MTVRAGLATMLLLAVCGCAYLPLASRDLPRCPGEIPPLTTEGEFVVRERVRFEHGDVVAHLPQAQQAHQAALARERTDS